MTRAEVQHAILVRAEIVIGADKKGRRFAQYYSKLAGRWIRCNLAAAEIALAEQALAQ